MTATRGSSPTSSKSLDRAARGSVLNFAGSIVAAVATLLTTIVVTRLTSQTEAGVFFVATSFFLLATGLGQLGTNSGLVYFLSGSRARGQLALASSYMRIAARPVVATSVLMALAIFLAADPLGRLLGPERPREVAGDLRIVAAFIPFAAVLNLALSGTRGLGTMKANAAVDQIGRSLLQLALVVLAVLVLGEGWAAGGWAAAYVPLAVLAWWWWRRLRDRAAPQGLSPQVSLTGAFWRFSAPRALAGVAQIAMQRLDIILVGSLAGLGPAAIYAATTRFLALGQMAARAVSLSVQPLLGEALARKDLNDAQSLYQSSTAWLVLVTWPLYLVLMGFGSDVLAVFGEGYGVGDRALLILCGAMLVATSCGMVDMVLIMAGKSLWTLGNVTLALVVNLALDLLLIPELGIVGAAIGWGSAILVGNLVPLAQVGFALKLHPFGGATLTSIGIATACFAGIPLSMDALVDSKVIALAAGLSVALAAYAAILGVMRHYLALDVLTKALRRRKKKPTTV